MPPRLFLQDLSPFSRCGGPRRGEDSASFVYFPDGEKEDRADFESSAASLKNFSFRKSRSRVPDKRRHFFLCLFTVYGAKARAEPFGKAFPVRTGLLPDESRLECRNEKTGGRRGNSIGGGAAVKPCRPISFGTRIKRMQAGFCPRRLSFSVLRAQSGTFRILTVRRSISRSPSSFMTRISRSMALRSTHR